MDRDLALVRRESSPISKVEAGADAAEKAAQTTGMPARPICFM
jgi:hypothetical protein